MTLEAILTDQALRLTALQAAGTVPVYTVHQKVEDLIVQAEAWLTQVVEVATEPQVLANCLPAARAGAEGAPFCERARLQSTTRSLRVGRWRETAKWHGKAREASA